MFTLPIITGIIFILLAIFQAAFSRIPMAIFKNFTQESVKRFTRINMLGLLLFGSAAILYGAIPAMSDIFYFIMSVGSIAIICKAIMMLKSTAYTYSV